MTKFSHLLKPDYRLQISLSEDADIAYLKNQLALSPLELLIKTIGDYQFDYGFNKPRGIDIKLLSDTDKSDRLVDIETDEYHKLIIPRYRATGIILLIDDLTTDDLFALQRRPIVIKAYRDSSVFIACTERWEVFRTEQLEKPLAYDAHVMPDALTNMLTIVNEVPEKSPHILKAQIERVTLRINAFRWYEKRLLSRQVAEAIHFSLVELESFATSLRAELKSVNLAARPDEFSKAFIDELCARLPQDEVVQAKAIAMRLVSDEANEVHTTELEKNDIEELLLPYPSGYLKTAIVTALLSEQLPNFTINPCKGCGQKPVVKQKKVTRPSGGKETVGYTFECKSCSAASGVSESHKFRSVALVNWNLSNLPNELVLPEAASLLTGARSNRDLVSWIRNAQAFNRITKGLKMECRTGHHGDKGRILSEKLSLLDSWVYYLNNAKFKVKPNE
ncbi:hypothetical protein [Rheinheimera hassiensis]|uniref:hypothetical protein n=1 Tax=Rheinheimera hassiensis TaxID=1193627 RepID=UPI001F064714|nr:hypothetical protein [Rheinheimera hassiensis]